ncbi:uncharacterized protein QC763_502840 [Podospora pseudopauciseta]|uniref:Peptidase S53 domain-containing protein n=1 Tax=Podospora pseudopauciseta TaxID=2093780 RepID=A0ABR0H7C7_9PEZI|nr:hypothetical protein QC763_502840 [Podospora pseudopauciseta]
MLLRSVLLTLASVQGLAFLVEGGPTTARSGRPLIVPRSHDLHERQHDGQLQGWVKRDLVKDGVALPVRIGLKQGREKEERAHKLLMDISDPKSPNYGKHLTAREVVDFFAPGTQAVGEVKQWLKASGVEERRLGLSGNKQWIQFDAPVQEVEKLLFARFHVYEHPESGVTNIACSEYHVPHNISHHIDYITPGIKLMAGGYDEKIVKRMVGRRGSVWYDSWYEKGRRPGDRKGRKKGGKDKDKDKDRGKGKGQGGSGATSTTSVSTPTATKPAGNIQPDQNEDEFEVTEGCDVDITPQCIRNQYQIPAGTKATKGNELGIFQGLAQHYNQQDMDTYWKYVAPWIPKGTHPELKSINGAEGPIEDPQLAGEEANLDFQVAIPLVWPQKTVLFQTDDEWYQQDQTRADTRYPGFFNTFFDAIDGSFCTMAAFNQTGNCADDSCRDPEYPNPNNDRYGYQDDLMCGTYRPTNVISISYSGFEHAWPESYTRRQCMEILKLSLQGVTVVESSGDYGVGGRRGDPQAGCLGPNREVFSPRIMGNCPYVLSVGATLVKADPKNKGKFIETATERFASGGGFSNVFMRPPWQEKHVAAYLKRANVTELGYNLTATAASTQWGWEPSLLGSVLGKERGKRFNKGGRGYPDVSAIGDNYRVVLRGYADSMSGTSVAVPVWASILTLINEERLVRGKRPVGFIHQVLYDHPEVFTDITSGSNPGCGSNGFPVKEGWDPVTGLGTPIYPKLLKLFLSLP